MVIDWGSQVPVLKPGVWQPLYDDTGCTNTTTNDDDNNDDDNNDDDDDDDDYVDDDDDNDGDDQNRNIELLPEQVCLWVNFWSDMLHFNFINLPLSTDITNHAIMSSIWP